MSPLNTPPGKMREESAGLFATTRWSVIRRAQANSADDLEALFKQYQAPLMAYLRHRRESHHTAEDLVQGFSQVLLKREFLTKVDQGKGRFRSFLLRAFQHYLNDEHDRRVAVKRGSGVEPDSLDETHEDGTAIHQPAGGGPSADLEYDRAWARTVLETALGKLEKEASAKGREDLFQALVPCMYGDETADSYREIGIRMGIPEASVKVAAFRFRGRLAALIREEVRQTVSSEAEFEDEMQDMFRLFQN